MSRLGLAVVDSTLLNVKWSCWCLRKDEDVESVNNVIGGFAKRAHPARARYLNVNLARRNRDLQPGGKEIEGGGRGGGGGEGGEGGEK